MMKKLWVVFVLLCLAFFLPAADAADVKNADKPAMGQWDLKMQKVWSIDSAGEDVLGEIRELKVSENGVVYFLDRGTNMYYIFDKNGKFIKAFGKKGEGPGEIKWFGQAPFFLVNNKIVIADLDKIHYFSKDGAYIRSVNNNYMRNRPTFFIDEEQFIAAPILQVNAEDESSAIKLYNLKTEKEKILTHFSIFKGGVARGDGGIFVLMDNALTPMMRIGYDGKRLYYGMNDSYVITVSDMNGKKQFTFALDRAAQVASNAEIRKRFVGRGHAPDHLRERIIKSMPNTATHFSQIELHKGLVYVFPTELDNSKPQRIDIFSADGKYIYRAAIAMGDGFSLQNIFLSDDNVYLALEDADGEVIINKYTVTLPKGNG